MRIPAKTEFTEEGDTVCRINGPLFFGSASGFLEFFKPEEDPGNWVLDFADGRVADR